MIADDDTRNTYALTCYLDAMDYGLIIHTAVNGQEAIDFLENRDDISIVLMDIMMPDMDGYEAMRQLRSRIRSRHLPIIAVTAQAMQWDRQKCLAAGATDYVSKPIDMDVLLKMMVDVLNPEKT
jgi:CheY-like chemotaxis protein